MFLLRTVHVPAYFWSDVSIIVGVLMYALIVSSVGTALSSIETPDLQRRRRMDAASI